MAKALYSIYPDPETLLAITPAELGRLILKELWDSSKELNRNNLSLEVVNRYPRNYHERIVGAAMEALSWLEREGLIAPTPAANGWYLVTRDGKAFKQKEEERRRSENIDPDPSPDTNKEPEDLKEQESSADVPAHSETFHVKDETICPSGISDQPARGDALGFEPYVRAIADFLTNDRTDAPLTLSIEGEWGSGKSSFMLQLRESLTKRGHLTVDFNAWRHDKADELWAAFALDFIRQITKEQSFWRQWWANIKLRKRRYDWAAGWVDILRFVATTGLWLLGSIAIPLLVLIKGWGWASSSAQAIAKAMGQSSDIASGVTKWVLDLGGAFTTITIAASVSLKLKQFIGNPVTIDLKKHLRSPNYEERVAFVERFHRDLTEIVECYVGKRKVYIFIDDLDRCDVPKAADLMQAINLMIANDPQLVFLIGMDRGKIAAGLAVKYEKLLPYLAPTQSETGAGAGLEFGYRFIEKFVQLPFKIPQPSESELRHLLDSLKVTSILQPKPRLTTRLLDRFARKRTGWKAIGIGSGGGDVKESGVQGTPEAVDQRVQQKRQRILNLIDGETETDTIRSIVLMVAPLLNHNPRRIKQFINLFRLKALIANETGLFDRVEDADFDEVLTLEQLGKFVALTQMYPRLLFDLDADRQLLNKLQYRAKRMALPDDVEFTEAVKHWQQQNEVMVLLSFGLNEGPSLEPARYSLGRLNVEKLLQVSPYVPRHEIEISLSDQPLAKDTVDIAADKQVAVGQSDKGVTEVTARFAQIDSLDLLEQVKNRLEERRRMFLVTVLEGAKRAYWDQDDFCIEFAPEDRHLHDTAAKLDNVKMIRDVMAEIVGRDVGLRLIVGDQIATDNGETLDNVDDKAKSQPPAAPSDQKLLPPILKLMHFAFDDVEKDDSGIYARIGNRRTANVNKAAVLDFSLEPISGSVPWVEAQAQIRFKDASDHPTRVGDPIWLGRDKPKVPFRHGETQSLVVTVCSAGTDFTTYEHQRRMDRPLERPLQGDMIRAEVTLVGEYMNDPQLSVSWYFKLTNGDRPTIEPITREQFEA